MFLMSLCQNGRIYVQRRKDKRLTRSLVHSPTSSPVNFPTSQLLHSPTSPLAHFSTRPLVNFSTRQLVLFSTRPLVSHCNLFSKNFNIMSALFATNRSPCRKKSILAKVCFDADKG